MVEMGVVPFDLRQPIYKYRTIAAAVETIRTNKVYFPNSIELKDKLELHPSIIDIEFTEETKKKYVDRIFMAVNRVPPPVDNNTLTQILTQSVQSIKTQVGIFSSGKSANNSFLWENYGENHSGVCLGFKIPDNAFGSHLSFNVNYTDNPLKIKFINPDNGELTKDLFYWFCTKDKSYISEQEVRVLAENHCGLTPFVKELISEVIFGRDTTIEDQELIVKILKENDYPVQKFGKIRISDSFYGLKIEPLSLNK
jgi:hypothetical protein